MKRLALLAFLALSSSSAVAQTAGDARLNAPAPGHRLYSPRPGTETHLVDRSGRIVHTWNSNYVVGVTAETILRQVRSSVLTVPPAPRED